MSKKLTTTIYITPHQKELLKQLNERTRVPVAEFIRQGIDLVLNKYQDELPGQMKLESLPLGSKQGLKNKGSYDAQGANT